MKKVFALFLALLMVVSCMVILPVAAEDEATEVTPWDGKKTTPEGTGREKDPYIIDSAGDLAWLAGFTADQRLSRLGRDGKKYYAQYASNALFTDCPIEDFDGSTTFESTYPNKYAAYHLPMVADDGSKMDWFDKIYVKQVCDIDMGGNTLAPIGNYWSNSQGTKGVKGAFFCGEYDGQGYTIYNGSFKPTGTNTNWVGGSMFGVVWGATIKNLNFKNVTGYINNGVSNNNASSFGLVVGRAVTFAMFGSKENIAEYEKVENAKTLIENVNVLDGCAVEFTAGGKSIGMGGIIGEMSNTTVKDCFSAAEIKIANTVADNARVNWIGGIVGCMYDDSWVENCIYAGHISVQSKISTETHIGGVVGSWRGITKGVNMGKNGIVGSANLGSFYIKNNGSTLCIGGVLGATSSLRSAGTNSVYVFDGNVNLSDAHNATAGTLRKGSIAGCFYNTAGSSKTYNPAAEYNTLMVTNCFAVGDFGSKSPSGSYPLVNNMFTERNYGASYARSADVGEGNVYYTRGDHFRALASETPYHYTDANADIAKLDADAVALYTRYYNIVNEFLFDGAAGTAEDPYKVDSLADLLWMSAHTGSAQNGGTQRLFRASWAGKYFVQVADIDLGGTAIWPMGTYVDMANNAVNNDGLGSGAQATTLANYRNLKASAFGGYYNGQGWSISNGWIMDTASDNNNWASGLFGVIYGATIKNVTLDNMTSMQNNTFGFIAGRAIADISKTNTPYVENGTAPVFDASYSDDFNVIDGCRVLNSTMTVGGIAKQACYGGIIGLASATTIRNCYTGDVLFNDNGADRDVLAMGGIVGCATVAVKVENCISGTDIVKNTGDGKNTIEQAFGGIVGYLRTVADPNLRTYTDGNDVVNSTTGTYFSMKNCINQGGFELKGTRSAAAINYGGLIGAVNGLHVTNNNYVVKNSFNLSDDVVVPAGYNASNNLRVGGLVGCRWIAGGNPADGVLELVNCASVEGPAVSANAYQNENGESSTGKFNLFNYYKDRVTAAGVAPITIVNSSEVPAIVDTEKEAVALDAIISDILNEITLGIDAAAAIGGSAVVGDRGKVDVTFYAAIAADVAKEEIVDVIFNITKIEVVDGEIKENNFEFHSTEFNKTVVAPDGYNLVAECTYGFARSDDKTMDFTFTVTVVTADGAVRSGYIDASFTVVNGVVVG